MDDSIAWKKYPQHRKWFNKLYVAEKFGYVCGPCGVAPDVSGNYIVRPIYNLSGMGAGARIKYIEAGDQTKVPPGYFWCEILEGTQYSVTYVFDTEWKAVSSYIGVNDPDFLWKFNLWKKSDTFPAMPDVLTNITDVQVINVEFIDNTPFEIHFRDTPDPNFNLLIPIWRGDESLIKDYEARGFRFIEAFDDADGFLGICRLGFMVK